MEALSTILSALPGAYIQGLVTYGTVIVIAYVLIWRLLGKRLQRMRIQLKQRADYAQIRSEIKHSLLATIPGAVTSATLLYLSSQGYTTLYTDMSLYGTFWSIACFFVLWIIDDAWF
jgi:hypothetical protein